MNNKYLVGNYGLLTLGIGPKTNPELKMLCSAGEAGRTGSRGFFLAA